MWIEGIVNGTQVGRESRSVVSMSIFAPSLLDVVQHMV